MSIGTVKSVPQSPSGSCFVHSVIVPSLISTIQGKEKLCRTCVQGWAKEWYQSLESTSSMECYIEGCVPASIPDSQANGATQ